MHRFARSLRGRFGLLFALLALVSVTGCKEEIDKPPDEYLPQTTEDNVLNNLQVAYRQRDIREYSKLLANDFQFYFDPATRQQLGIEFWTRTTDSLQTQGLFESPEVTKIVIDLKWPARSATGAGFLGDRAGWKKLFLTDVYLDVDFAPVGQPEPTTFRVEDQRQRYYFRQGKTYPPSGAGDTLMYIVEWRDDGTAGASISGIKAH